jgi:hypothetical protein
MDTLFLNDTLVYQTRNDTAIASLLFCNTCSSPVTVDSQSVQGDPFDYFIVDSLPPVVAPGVCDTVKIGFSPNLGTTPLRKAQFVVKTNARTTGNLTRQLAGVGCTQFASLADTAFVDSLHAGDSVTYTSRLTNTGICPIRIDSVTFVNDTGYVLVSNALAGRTLLPDSAVKIVVRLVSKTSSKNIKKATLHIFTNATNNPPRTITYNVKMLKTSVKEPAIVVTAYSLAELS